MWDKYAKSKTGIWWINYKTKSGRNTRIDTFIGLGRSYDRQMRLYVYRLVVGPYVWMWIREAK